MIPTHATSILAQTSGTLQREANKGTLPAGPFDEDRSTLACGLSPLASEQAETLSLPYRAYAERSVGSIRAGEVDGPGLFPLASEQAETLRLPYQAYAERSVGSKRAGEVDGPILDIRLTQGHQHCIDPPSPLASSPTFSG